VPELATSFPDASGAAAFARPFLTLRLRVAGKRSILQLGSGWANGAKLPKGGKGNGEKKPPLPEGAPPTATYMPATTTSLGLDQTILEFFKTKEFASAVSKVSAVEQTSNWQTKSADFERTDRARGTTDQQGHFVGLPFYDDAEAEALQACPRFYGYPYNVSSIMKGSVGLI
jgi:hypothetical protein